MSAVKNQCEQIRVSGLIGNNFALAVIVMF